MKRPVVGVPANRRLAVPLIVLLLFMPGRIASQTVLVDFGATSGADAFGLAGWTTPLMGPLMARASDGPGGLVADASADEYADYQGVRGSARRFTTADRIVVTWYNRSDEVVRFTARISFTDADQPDGGTSSGRWYTMRRADNYRDTWAEAGPQETVQTMFVVTGEGTHKTDSIYALVNVNLAIEWGMSDRKQFLVCDRIELYGDADVTPPAAPTGVQATDISDSKIRIVWETPSDNVGVYDYLIYLNGEVEGYSRETNYTCVFLEPGKDYRLAVTARDMMLNESARSWEVTVRTAPYRGGKGLIGPHGISYLGAFRLPDEFFWGGEDLTFRADGDGGGGGEPDGYPGSLFVTNVNQQEHGYVGEASIPAPVSGANLDNLPVAMLLRTPVNVRPPLIDAWDYVDIWRTGLEYLADEQRLYSSWSIHYSVTGEKHASLSATDTRDLSTAPRLGPWYLGDPLQPPTDAAMSDWLFALPSDWADTHVGGRRLVTGRCRDGGLSGLGPTLYAFAPVGSSPPVPNATVDFTTLLQYGPVSASDNYHYPDAIDGYNHSDDWRGVCWVNTGTQSAVALIGRKALGDNWYGYHGERMLNDWVYVDVPYPNFDGTDPNGKGWRAHRQSPMIVLYDPAQLADVAAGRIASHEPQPYAALRLDPARFFSPKCEIFSAAFDPDGHILYVTEFVGDTDGALVVHVMRVDDVATHTDLPASAAEGIRLRCHPNPFRAGTQITFVLPEETELTLRIYDTYGRLVAQPAQGRYAPGNHAIRFDAPRGGLLSGVYFAVLNTDLEVSSTRFVFLR